VFVFQVLSFNSSIGPPTHAHTLAEKTFFSSRERVRQWRKINCGELCVVLSAAPAPPWSAPWIDRRDTMYVRQNSGWNSFIYFFSEGRRWRRRIILYRTQRTPSARIRGVRRKYIGVPRLHTACPNTTINSPQTYLYITNLRGT